MKKEWTHKYRNHRCQKSGSKDNLRINWVAQVKKKMSLEKKEKKETGR